MPNLVEIGLLVLKKKIFFNINICKYGFPYCGPSRPPWTMMLTILNLHYIRKLSCKYYLFWLSGSGEDFLMTPPHFCIFVIISPLKSTWPLIWTIYNSLYRRMTYAKFDWNWPAGSEEKIFFNTNICKYGFPYCGPFRPPGVMVLTILNLHYIRKLSCKYDLFWLSGSGEEDFSMTPPHFCIFVIISPLKRTWPFI